MERRTYLNILFDYYGDLLTPKEREYFKDYYINDLSITEIADNNRVSRSAVGKGLQIVAQKLEQYEDILKMYSRRQAIVNLLDDKINQDLCEKIENILS